MSMPGAPGAAAGETLRHDSLARGADGFFTIHYRSVATNVDIPIAPAFPQGRRKVRTATVPSIA